MVGDFVVRARGEGDSKYGKVLAKLDAPDWLVVSGGRIYRDPEGDLCAVRTPWLAWYSDGPWWQ